MSLVIVGRLFMGLGGGGMDILESIIICDITTLRERALYIGINMAFCALGTVAGPILGGSLGELITWRWFGWINLPLVGTAFVLAILFLNLKPIDMEFNVKIRRLDALV